MDTVTVSPKYQVVIPRALRERMHIEPGARMMMMEVGGTLRLVPILPPHALRGMARGISPHIEDDPDRAF